MGRTYYGVGTNNRKYQTSYKIEGKWKSCPFYLKWTGIMYRCYSDKAYIDKPTYRNCTVCDEWLEFSVFKEWMEIQDWKGKCLDKDLLSVGSKVYSPETCVFIDMDTNNLFLDKGPLQGPHPTGVSFNKRERKFVANCNYGSGRKKQLGYFKTESEAHKSYLNFKSKVVESRVERQTDQRVKDVLIFRANEMKQQAAAL